MSFLSDLRFTFVSLVLFAGVAGCTPEAPRTVASDSAAPVVVETFPRAGEQDVAPGPGILLVVFSEPMAADKWSFVRVAGAEFPIVGEPSMSGDRAFEAPMALEPATTYGVRFNTERHQGFRDLDATPALSYQLVFTTGPAR